MNITWVVSGPFTASSSYHQQVQLFTRYLMPYGHSFQIIHYVSDADIPNVIHTIRQQQPDVVITIGDGRIYNLPAQTGVPELSWMMHGGGEAQDLSEERETLFACVSEDAKRAYDQHSHARTAYLPFGYDPQVFYAGDRQAARARLGWQHTVATVLMVSTNHMTDLNPLGIDLQADRKNWEGGLCAFAAFRNLRPEVKLCIHTNLAGFVDIRKLIHKLGLEDCVLATDQRYYQEHSWEIPPPYVADLCRASNVLLYPSLGEGFGLPLIEAQACGIPVVTTRSGPMTELALTGTAVIGDVHPVFSGWTIPKHEGLVQALADWIDYDEPTEITTNISSFSAPKIIGATMRGLLEELVVAA